jgi:integrase
MQLSTHEKVNSKKLQSMEDLPHTGLLIKYLDNVKSMNTLTAMQYKSELNSFVKFVYDTYGCDVDSLVSMIIKNDTVQKKTNFDPYDVLSRYTAFLVGTIAPITIKHRVLTTKNFFEYCDIEISPRKFSLKVRLPKSVRKEKEPLNKEKIVTIINACSNMRLKTYVMLLAATGMRATEALSIRICDLDLESNPSKQFVRGEYTKTRSDRTILLTQEIAQQLKYWLEYKYRTRRVSFYEKNTHKSTSEYRTPSKRDHDLVFSMNTSSKGYLHVSIRSLYVELRSAFGKTLDRLGKGQKEESPGAKHRKITLHSFRRWVKSTISDLGYYDYSEWFIGHGGSTYYRKSEKEKAELFRKIEPYLTFLNYEELERRGADITSQLEEKNRMIQHMMRKQEQFEQLLQSLINSGQLKPTRHRLSYSNRLHSSSNIDNPYII